MAQIPVDCGFGHVQHVPENALGHLLRVLVRLLFGPGEAQRVSLTAVRKAFRGFDEEAAVSVWRSDAQHDDVDHPHQLLVPGRIEHEPSSTTSDLNCKLVQLFGLPFAKLLRVDVVINKHVREHFQVAIIHTTILCLRLGLDIQIEKLCILDSGLVPPFVRHLHASNLVYQREGALLVVPRARPLDTSAVGLALQLILPIQATDKLLPPLFDSIVHVFLSEVLRALVIAASFYPPVLTPCAFGHPLVEHDHVGGRSSLLVLV
mmetsp:Transcript_31731/g.91758  ORF Transcript_31731/g.91758 Transcript_31731/m.91758 type:complete len:262 (-) Transcript_31731:893-1678(-)